jgi:uncharacterized protein (DUF4213/DUF364 family)
MGLAYAFPHEVTAEEAAQPCPTCPSARELARLAGSNDLLLASVGVAAINSLVPPIAEELEPGNGHRLLAEYGAGRSVALVGHFSFIEELRQQVRELWVLELHPEEGDLPACEAPRILPQADVVAISGSTLVNHTLEDLLALAKGRQVVLLGPSSIFSPILFDHGICAVCGAVVRDEEEVLRCVSAGVDFRCSAGIEKVIWRR